MMHEGPSLAADFERNRSRLRAVAYRMLGSEAEAEDAVQETWLRLSRADSTEVGNLGGWLTTVVARICLDMLRSRKSRREEELDPSTVEASMPLEASAEEGLLDSIGLAMLVVLGTLPPAERVAFVLHDMFDLSFDEIAPIVGRSTVATRQLASRARRRVQGGGAEPDDDLARRREIVDAFLAASRGGDFGALLTVLDADVVFRGDASARRLGARAEMRGADTVAKFFSGRAHGARLALVDGDVALRVERDGELLLVLVLTFDGGRISEIEAVAEPSSLAEMDIVLADA